MAFILNNDIDKNLYFTYIYGFVQLEKTGENLNLLLDLFSLTGGIFETQ